MAEKFIFETTEEQVKLVKFIVKSLNGAYSAGAVYKALRKKEVKVNGARIKEDIGLKRGDIVELFLTQSAPSAAPALYSVVYEDDDLLVVNKEQGIAVHAGSEPHEKNLIDELTARAGGSYVPHLCHRIDRNTGGLVIIAKNKDALDAVLEAIEKREIEKTYGTIVSGVPPSSGELVNYMAKNERNARVYIHTKKEAGDLTAITYYTVMKSDGALSLLDVRLETGRMHQIRAQLAHAGFPIIGDGKYGNTVINRKYNVKKQILFAYKLKFMFDKKSPLAYLNSQVIEIDPGLAAVFEQLSLLRKE